MTYHNKELTDKALDLMSILTSAPQGAYGHFLTGMRNRISHQDPETRNRIQREVDAAAQSMTIIFLFSIFDEFIDEKIKERWISLKDKRKLWAFRHIRNSCAHGIDGKRSIKCRWRNEFDNLMATDEKIMGIIIDQTNDRFILAESHFSYECYQFMMGLSQRIAGHLANNNLP